MTITVTPGPVVAEITGASTVYAGSAITLANTTTSGVWSSGDTAVATVDNHGVVTGASAGKSVITYSVSTNDCTATASKTITVNAHLVVAEITGKTAVCLGSATTLSSATPSGVWSSGSTAIATVDQNGLVTGVSKGTSVIAYAVTTNGETISVTKTVTVKEQPSIPGTISLSYCLGEPLSILSATVASGNTATWYRSKTDGTGLAVVPTPSSSAAGSFDYFVSQTDPETGCEGERAKLTFTIHPIPGIATIKSDDSGNLVSSEATGNQWYMNGLILAGETSQVLKPVESGPYTVVQNQNGCPGPISDVYHFVLTSESNLKIDEHIKIYPNPVQSILKIDFDLIDNKQVDLKIFDATGRLIFEQKKMENGAGINLSHVVTGIYHYLVTGEGGKFLQSGKFMKN
jgi:hypothetical protein